MRVPSILTWFALCLLLCSPQARAAEASTVTPALADPVEAVVTPSGAGVRVRETVPVEREDGQCVLRLLVPAGAEGLSVRVAGETVARTRAITVPLAPASGLARDMAALAAEKAGLDGEVAIMDAWIAQSVKERDVRADFATMYASRQEALERAEELALALKTRESLPRTATLVIVTLAGTVSSVSVDVEYGYLLPDSGWSPRYRFDCRPGQDGEGRLDARLEALVRQNSGADWRDTRIVLASSGRASGSMPALREWVVGDEDFPAVMSAALDGPAAGTAPTPRRAGAARDTGGAYVTWTPLLGGLAHGETRVLLAEASWAASPMWLARPLDGDAPVHLCVEQELDGEAALWPAGRAELSVDGAYVGSAAFSPRDGRVLLSFGADPRVRLTARAEPRKRGTAGIIGQKRVWEWAWTYTLRNDRDGAVTVRVERPLPVSVDSAVTVEARSEPAHREEERALVWEVPLAPGEEAAISHGVKVTAPEKLDIHPVAP